MYSELEVICISSRGYEEVKGMVVCATVPSLPMPIKVASYRQSGFGRRLRGVNDRGSAMRKLFNAAHDVDLDMNHVPPIRTTARSSQINTSPRRYGCWCAQAVEWCSDRGAFFIRWSFDGSLSSDTWWRFSYYCRKQVQPDYNGSKTSAFGECMTRDPLCTT